METSRDVGLCIRIVMLAVLFGQVLSDHGCDLPTCDQGSNERRNSHELWYNEQPGFVYSHVFKIEQTSSVQTTNWPIVDEPPSSLHDMSGEVKEDDNRNEGSQDDRARIDSQTTTITGSIELVRGTGAMSCTASFIVTNSTITFKDVNGNDTMSRPLILEGPTIFPFMFFSSDPEEQDIRKELHNICVPQGEDAWKTNLRRSLVFMLASNVKLYNDLKSKGPKDFHRISDEETQLVNQTDLFGPVEEGVTNYGMYISETSPTGLMKLRVHPHTANPHQLTALRTLSKEIDLHYKNLTVVEELKTKTPADVVDGFYTDWMKILDPFSNFGLTLCYQTFRNGMIHTAHCGELQRVATQSYLAVDVTTKAEIKTIKNDNPIAANTAQWKFDGALMNKVPMKYDSFSTILNSDATIVQDFSRLMSELCENVDSPKSLQDYGERIRTIMPLISTKVLKEQFTILKEKNCGATSAFLNLVSSTASDDSVEFMVDLITRREDAINDAIFANFLWTATLMPTTERDDFQRYAGHRSIEALQKLLDAKEFYHRKYGMSDPEFLLHMVGVLDKERKSEEIEDIVPGAMYVLEIATFISAVENNRTDDAIDRATHLQIIGALEKYSQQLDPNGDDDDDDISDPFERLIVSHPCSKKHATFLAQILEDEKYEEDLKIMAYLFMRKCYIPEWREMIKGYVKSKKANVEVVYFIVQHVDAISEGYNSLQYADDEEEVASAVESTTGNVTSELGYTIFSTSDTDIKLYGHREVKKAQIGIEINVVKGRNFIPRLVRMKVQTFGNDGEQTNVELELVRLESGKSKEPELLVTFSENGVALYTTTITLDQSKLLRLLQDGSESAIVDFLSSFSIMNRPFLTKFLQNRKLEVFKRVLFHEYRRNFPSLSGLPIKTRVNLDWIFSHNFTNHYEQGIDGGKLYSFRLNPAFSCQMLEQISVGFGHDEILGYQLSSGISLNYNLELVLSRSKNGVYKAKIGFGRDKSKTKYFEFASLNVLKLERHQILLDSLDVKKSSGHIWKSKNGPSVDQVELETYSDLLKDRICRLEHELQGLFSSGPIFLSGSYLCDIPSAIIFEFSPTVNSQQVSLDLKVYPEGGYSHHDEIPHYLWRIGIRTNHTENFKLYDYHVQSVDPSKHHELNVTLRLQEEITLEHSFKVNYSGSKGSYGFEIYKTFFGYPEYQSPRGENQRRRRSTEAPIQKISFGITAWSPIPGYEKVNLIVGGLSYEPEESVHVFFETEGIHPSLNSELQYTMSKGSADAVNLPMSIDGEDYVIPKADRIKVTFEMENDELGKFTLKNNFLKFRSPVPRQTRDRLNGTFEITYGRREWNTISGDYNSYIKTFPSTEDEPEGWIVSKDTGFQCDIRFSQFAILDFTLVSKCHEMNKYELNLTNDADCGGCMNGTHKANCHSEVWFKHSPKNVVQKVSWESDKTVDDSEVEKDDDGCRLWKMMTKWDVDLPGLTLLRFYTKENNFRKIISLLEIGFQMGIFFESSSLWSRVFYKIEDVTTDLLPRPQVVFEVSAKEPDEADYMFWLEQKLVVISDLLIDYNGTMSLPRMGVNYKFDGTLEPAFPRSWFIYKGFNIAIKTGQEGNKPYSFSLKEIPDEESAKHYKLLLTGQHPIFDSSIKLLKTKSPEGYRISVKSAVPGFYNIKADMGSGIVHFVLHVDGEELKIQGKVGWPGDATEDKLLIVKLDGTNVKTGQSVFSLNSLSELKHISSSSSIVLRDFQIISLPDILVISKSDLLITYPIGATPINKTLDLSFQLYPHEEPQRPIISMSLVDGISGDKYSAQISSQVKCPKTPCDMTDLVVGEWIVLERPSVRPYTLSWTMTPSYEEDSHRPPSARNRVLFNNSLTLQIEVHMSHHGFLCPELDTEIDSRFLGTRIGRYWAEYNGDKENPSMREVLFLNTTASFGFDFLVKADGVQSLAERNLHGDVTRIEHFYKNKQKADSLWGGYFRTAGGRRDDLKLHYNVTLEENNSRYRFNDTAGSPNPVSTRIESWVRDILNVRMFKDRFTEIGWSWISGIDGEDSDEDSKDVSEGIHRFNVFFDSWRNFDLQAGHTVKCILGDYSWTDKLYSLYPTEDGLSEGTCGIQSSKLFSGSTKTKLGGVETTVEILYPMFRTRLTSTYETPAPEAGDPFIHMKYKLKCASVLLDEDIVLDFDSGTAHSSNGVEYKTYLAYSTPWITKTNFTSNIKRQKGSHADLHGEFMTHTATSIQDPSEYGSRMEWKSISLILYENQGQSHPIFLHYDYDTQVSRYYASDAKYSPSYKSSGSFSSTPGPSQQLLQLRLDKKRSWNSDDCIIERDEAMIRLGRLVEEKEVKCQEVTSYLSTLLDNEKSCDMENIIKFYKSKLACGRCRPNGDCKESVGHFLLNSMQTNDSVDELSLKFGQLPASIQQNSLIQAVWSEEGSCSAERADFNLYGTNNLENGDKVCAKALKDLGGCWAGLKAAKCNKSAKSKGAKLWKDIVTKMNPTAISGTGDAFISYFVWFFHT